MQLPNTMGNPETINVHVIVKTGETFVNNATVTIDETTRTTGSAGGCNLPNIPIGIHTITVTKEGYDEYMDSISVSNEDNEFVINLTEE